MGAQEAVIGPKQLPVHPTSSTLAPPARARSYSGIGSYSGNGSHRGEDNCEGRSYSAGPMPNDPTHGLAVPGAPAAWHSDRTSYSASYSMSYSVTYSAGVGEFSSGSFASFAQCRVCRKGCEKCEKKRAKDAKQSAKREKKTSRRLRKLEKKREKKLLKHCKLVRRCKSQCQCEHAPADPVPKPSADRAPGSSAETEDGSRGLASVPGGLGAHQGSGRSTARLREDVLPAFQCHGVPPWSNSGDRLAAGAPKACPLPQCKRCRKSCKSFERLRSKTEKREARMQGKVERRRARSERRVDRSVSQHSFRVGRCGQQCQCEHAPAPPVPKPEMPQRPGAHTNPWASSSMPLASDKRPLSQPSAAVSFQGPTSQTRLEPASVSTQHLSSRTPTPGLNSAQQAPLGCAAEEQDSAHGTTHTMPIRRKWTSFPSLRRSLRSLTL